MDLPPPSAYEQSIKMEPQSWYMAKHERSDFAALGAMGNGGHNKAMGNGGHNKAMGNSGGNTGAMGNSGNRH